jgi:hypothetical protein
VTRRAWYFAAFTLLAIAAAVLLPAVPQPAEYHRFADARPMLGIANFLDVASNAAFLLAGLAGLWATLRPGAAFASPRERWPYALFFSGLLLTAAGSAYYHLWPDNETLFWDRVPMTVAFMSLIASQVVDRLSVRAGLALLLPMLVLGIVSVVYWRVTERAGVGNVVPYAVLQAYAVVAVAWLAVLHPSRYTHGNAIYAVFAAYVLAKVLEHFDHELYALGGVVSGHTLKHVAAAVAGFVVCRMLLSRREIGHAAARGDRVAVERA